MKRVSFLLYKRKLWKACPQYSAPVSCWISSSGRNSIPVRFCELFDRWSVDREIEWEWIGWEIGWVGKERMGKQMEIGEIVVINSDSWFCNISSTILSGWGGSSTNWRMWFVSKKDCSIVFTAEAEGEEEESNNTSNGRLYFITFSFSDY